MNEYENNRKEHKVTVLVGVALIVLLAIFVAKKRYRPSPEFPGVRPVSGNEDDYIADILSDASLIEEEYAVVAGADEISVSVGGRDIAEPVAVVDVAPDEEVIEPVTEEEQGVEYETYVVKKGDTLSVIAQRFYGDASRWRLIAKENDLKDANTLRVGMELVIPQRRAEEPSRPPRLETPADHKVELAGANEDETKAAGGYTVKKNDSLWKIAEAQYGDGNRWKMVFEANRDLIRNKNSLRPGQVIKIPKP